MSVTAIRPNKPARYGPGPDGKLMMLADADEPAANLASSDALVALRGLVELLGDQKATQKKIADLSAAEAKANSASEQLRAERQNTEAAIAALARAEGAQQKRLADLELEHTQKSERRLRDVELREAAVEQARVELAKREAKLQSDRAKLDKKLAAVREAAGE